MTNRMKRITWKLSLAMIFIALTGGLMLPVFNARSGAGDRPVAPTVALPALQGEAAIRQLKEQGVYDSLQKAVEATRYEMRWEEQPALRHLPPSYYAPNPAQQLDAYFTSHGLHLTPQRTRREAIGTHRGSDQAAWQAEMKLVGYGYGESLQPVGPAEFVAHDNRIEYRRTGLGLTEWYVNKAEGLEQGFTIDAPPGGKPQGERLRLVLQLSGDLRAELAEEGRAIALKQEHGQVALRYSDLHAYDAEGQVLPSAMRVSEGRVLLEVEEAGALYPVTIDPLLTQQQKLTVDDGLYLDQFGFSVAISGDTVVVGAYMADIDFVNDDQGAAYVFVRSGATWSLQQKLIAGDKDFGYSVAISGETVVVGAPGSFAGAAYVFVRSGTSWSQQQWLRASDAAWLDSFGYSVAISGDTVVVGATRPFKDHGSAYIFVRSGSAWSEQQKLSASDAGTWDFFGRSVAMSGETVVVGAQHLLSSAPGSAYIFVRSGSTWTEQQKLTASDGAIGDDFGISVAISGNTAVAGASHDDNQGSAYVFVRNGATWSQQQKLTASDRAALDNFGNSVSISGENIVVGAANTDYPTVNQGSAYVFVRTGSSWSQQEKLIATDGATGDLFGSSVAISGSRIVVGARMDNIGNGSQGSAYMFSNLGQRQKLTADDGTAYDEFGYSVAISGNTTVVGASHDDTGSNSDQGSAYVFVRSGTSWSKQQKLVAGDGTTGDEFGDSVAISGQTIVVGAWRDDIGSNVDQGSAYVFVRNGLVVPNPWTEQAKLIAFKGAASDFFGHSVAINDDTVVVGAPWDDVGANVDQGSAHVSVRTGSSWSQPVELTASDGAAYDEFGYSVAMSLDTIVVGAPWDDVVSSINQGSVYIFAGLGTSWSQKQKVTAFDGTAWDYFGNSVAISGETLVIGALDNFWGKGSAYVFVRSISTWSKQAKLTASDAAVGDYFGSSVAISGDIVVIGAPGDDIGSNTDQGSVYVFERTGTSWSQLQKLTAGDGAASEDFGFSVAISGTTVVIGANGDDIGSNYNRGSAYLFAR